MTSLIQIFNNKLMKVIGGCSVLGLSAYTLYFYIKKRNRMTDEGFVDVVPEEPVKRILVLGLDGAGKTTFLSQIAKLQGHAHELKSEGEFNIVSIREPSNKGEVYFWETAGSKPNRPYWLILIPDADLLIYLVDSTDDHRLAESVREFHILLTCDKLKNIPIIIVANKQDLENPASPSSIAEAFEVPMLSKSYKIMVYPLEMPPYENYISETVRYLKGLAVELLFKK